MRAPDLNRVKRAQEHLDAAKTQLRSIKWENISVGEYELLRKALDEAKELDFRLQDIVTVGSSVF